MGSMRNCLNSLQELQNSGGNGNGNQSQSQQISSSHFDHPTHDDFLDQMLSNLPSWTDNHHHHQNPKSPWDLNPNTTTTTNTNKLFNIPIGGNHNNKSSLDILQSEDPNYPTCDDSTLLASRLRQHQISTSPKSLVLQQQLLLSAAAAAAAAGGGGGTGDSVLFPLPLTLGNGGDSSDSRLMRDDSVDAPFKSSEGPVQALFNGLTGGLPRTGQVPNQQHFHHTQTGSISTPSFGGPSNGMNQSQATVSAGGGTAAPTRQKVRARRGQATDPHSIAERLRRERIAERMKALQELVPNANKTDKASMLDEIIEYVKFLQLQVKVLSMSRLGGASALVADISSEGGGDCIQANGGGLGRNNNNNGKQTASTNDSLSVTEHQVAKLMEEDMGSAMQYLQGKGLCLMPISLATAISSATSHSRNANNNNNNNMMNHSNNPLLATNADGPASPSMSVLTVQSATVGNGGGAVAGGGGGGDQTSVKDATSVSKP